MKFGWEVLQNPPYSSDLAPSDFHLFVPLKKLLGGKCFDSEEVKLAARPWLYAQKTDFYKQGIL